MSAPSPLDDPATAAHAWARYRRLMTWMVGVTVPFTIAVLGMFYWQEGMVSIHFYIASGLGIIVSMLLTAALVGLGFLSSGTGHDQAVADFKDD